MLRTKELHELYRSPVLLEQQSLVGYDGLGM